MMFLVIIAYSVFPEAVTSLSYTRLCVKHLLSRSCSVLFLSKNLSFRTLCFIITAFQLRMCFGFLLFRVHESESRLTDDVFVDAILWPGVVQPWAPWLRLSGPLLSCPTHHILEFKWLPVEWHGRWCVKSRFCATSALDLGFFFFFSRYMYDECAINHLSQ